MYLCMCGLASQFLHSKAMLLFVGSWKALGPCFLKITIINRRGKLLLFIFKFKVITVLEIIWQTYMYQLTNYNRLVRTGEDYTFILLL